VSPRAHLVYIYGDYFTHMNLCIQWQQLQQGCNVTSDVLYRANIQQHAAAWYVYYCIMAYAQLSVNTFMKPRSPFQWPVSG